MQITTIMVKNHITATAAILLVLAGCNKHLDLPPEDFFADGNYWRNEAQVTNFMAGIHGQLRGQQFQLFRLGEMRGGGLSATAVFPVSLSEQNVIEQDLSEDKPSLATWAGFMNPILQINLFIHRVEAIGFLAMDKKNTLLGQAYGIRAFYYFHLLRTYGGVPLRLTPDLLLEKPDPVTLRMARSSEADVLNAIKADIARSLELFGTNQTANKAYWTLNATRMLKGEVFLWSAKVYGNTADLAEAKATLEAVTGYALLPDFAAVFGQKRNAEIIFALPFAFNEAAASASSFFLYDLPNFSGLYYKDTVNAAAPALIDPLVLQQSSTQNIQRYRYTYELFQAYHADDQRREATFYDFYAIDRTASPQKVTARNTVLAKFLGAINNNIRHYTDDWPVYREADRLLLLAEIANAEGADPTAFVQPVRDRAFKGADPAPFANAGRDANEIAIFEERMREFVWEGKRWYDVRRMRAGGDPLAFKAGSHPYGQLDKATESHKLLWPIGRGVWTDDPLVDQTPGYKTTKI